MSADSVAAHRASPAGLMASLAANTHLIRQMTKRDIAMRYRGSLLGICWAFVHPLLMLSVYTFVFSFVFRARWGDALPLAQETGGFALLLFSGLVLHGFLAECLGRSPSLILQHSNFVKKVIFPLEILPLMLTGTALFHLLLGYGILLLAMLVLGASIPATALWLPVVVAPLLILGLGISWILASFGVFLRDIGQLMQLLITLLLFLCPIFYPLSALPETLQPWLYLNPLTFIVETSRGLLFAGTLPEWKWLAAYYVAALSLASLGFWWFQKTRKGFADVM